MNKNKTPTQLMIEAARSPRSDRGAPARSDRGAPAQWQHGVDELARVIAETVMAQVPDGVEGELGTWLRTREGTRALRESWPRAVEAYLARSGADTA